MATVTSFNHMLSSGDWIRINGKLYRVCGPITKDSFTVKRLYWYHHFYNNLKLKFYEIKRSLLSFKIKF